MATSTSRKTPRAGPATTFFEELGRRGHEPLLRKVTGSVRFDVVDGKRTDSWLVAVDKGDITVERAARAADCTIAGDGAVFDEVVTGHKNATAAMLRGALACTGDLDLLAAIQRIFPNPPSRWDPTVATRSSR